MNDRESSKAEVNLLIRQAQGGSVDAYEELFRRYRPLIDSVVSGFVAPDMSRQDAEDLFEEAKHVFLSALTSYDLGQDAVEFGLYAKICLKNGLISELRRQKRRKKLGVVSLSEDDLAQRDVTVAYDPASELIEEEDFHRLYRRIRSCLSEFENSVWWMYVSGVGTAEIAKRLGKDEKSVHNAVYRIRAKLKALLADGNTAP